jgi:hypothetical protein
VLAKLLIAFCLLVPSAAFAQCTGNFPANTMCGTTTGGIPHAIAIGTTGTGVASVTNTDGTLTISPTTGPVISSLALAHANTWSAAQSFNAAAPSLVGVRSGKWYANDSPPNNELRWKDKFFGGDAAANYPNNSGPFIGNTCAAGDWFSNFFSTTQQGSCSYLGIFQMVVLSDASNPNATGGILGAAQSKNNPGGTQGTQGVMGLALNNGVSATFASYAGYFECDQVVNNGTQCIATEYDIANTISNAYAGNPDPFTQSKLVGIHVACGSGFGAFPTVFNCGSAQQIVNNGNLWKVGINVLNNSIAAQTIFASSVSVAMAMAPNYGFVWYSAAGTPLAMLGADNTGEIFIAGGLRINGSAGVTKTCTVLPTVTNGIVTSC